MESLSNFLNWLSGIVWGPYMIALLVGTGIFLTFRTRFLQIRCFKMSFKETFTKIFKPAEGEGEIKSFQALAAALSACIGVGNIAGVATAIALGGPGAIFWMWVSAFFGMTTKYSEIVLSMKYREKDENGVWRGGPMYVLKNALHWKGAGVFFAVITAFVGLISCNMVQSNSVASALSLYNIPPYVTGIILAVLTYLVIFGGVKRLGSVTSLLTPFMGVFYIIGALIIIILNIDKVIPAFALIISSAFTGQAAVGGFAGAGIMQAMRFGVARGIFSNEAGIGSSPMIHATATVDHPGRQGLYGIMEVFLDTIVVCTMTALVIITTGIWQEGLTGAALSTKAFEVGLPGGVGGFMVSIAIALFAFSTVLSWSWYGETAVEYLLGAKAITPYRIFWILCVFLGAVTQLDLLWLMADTVNGFMAIPNLIALIALNGTVVAITNEFLSKEKADKLDTK